MVLTHSIYPLLLSVLLLESLDHRLGLLHNHPEEVMLAFVLVLREIDHLIKPLFFSEH